jgi:hypothetical protein
MKANSAFDNAVNSIVAVEEETVINVFCSLPSRQCGEQHRRVAVEEETVRSEERTQ